VGQKTYYWISILSILNYFVLPKSEAIRYRSYLSMAQNDRGCSFFMLCCLRALFSHHSLSGRVWAASVVSRRGWGSYFSCTAVMGAPSAMHPILNATKVPFTTIVKTWKWRSTNLNCTSLWQLQKNTMWMNKTLV